MPDSPPRANYRRRLPHWQSSRGSVFLTRRLYGSPPPGASTGRLGLDFVRHDRRLERDQLGPHWLKRPDIAQVVIDALRYAEVEQQRFLLDAWVVMPNHLHLLLTPAVALRTITQGLKGFTAREANQILQRRHSAFWQDESFDHWIRDGYEFERVVHYIEQNPVKAGLVTTPEQWPWSSIHDQLREE